MFNIDKSIDKTTPVPLFFQLRNLILEEIKSGNFKTGDLIPTELEIGEAFNISRTTVRQAITDLVSKGWLYRIKGKGTFVATPHVENNRIVKTESFNQHIEKLGKTPKTEVFAFRKMRAGEEISKILNISPNDFVIYIGRRRFADSDPVVTVKTYLPYKLCEFVFDYDLEHKRLYEILSKNTQTAVCRVESRIEAVSAATQDVKMLGIRRNKPMQLVVSVGYNAFDKPVEYSFARYRGDCSQFNVTVYPE